MQRSLRKTQRKRRNFIKYTTRKHRIGKNKLVFKRWSDSSRCRSRKIDRIEQEVDFWVPNVINENYGRKGEDDWSYEWS